MRPLRYVLLLLATALACGPVIHFATWAWPVAACRLLRHPPAGQAGAFLAYCEQPLYGSYEHEAYLLDTENGAVRSMQAAKVLFLGNSRVQFGFSTPQTDAFFRARGVPYHLLGFGYGENSAFPRLLVRRWHPAPRAVVINADPFFQNALSAPAYALQRNGAPMLLDAGMKKLFGALQPWLCARTALCTGTAPSTYRDPATGQWIWHGVLLPRDTVAGPVPDARLTTWSESSLPGWVHEAESFLAELGVPRDCVILTGVPNPQVDGEGMATAIGRALGTPVVLARLPGLETVDNSHLSADSAERWSAAVLEAAAPVLDACLSGFRLAAEGKPALMDGAAGP